MVSIWQKSCNKKYRWWFQWPRHNIFLPEQGYEHIFYLLAFYIGWVSFGWGYIKVWWYPPFITVWINTVHCCRISYLILSAFLWVGGGSLMLCHSHSIRNIFVKISWRVGAFVRSEDIGMYNFSQKKMLSKGSRALIFLIFQIIFYQRKTLMLWLFCVSMFALYEVHQGNKGGGGLRNG